MRKRTFTVPAKGTRTTRPVNRLTGTLRVRFS
jgi:hypothetical protein